MKYILLADNGSNEPREMLVFYNDPNAYDVQMTINDLNDYFFEHDDEILKDFCCQTEFVIDRLGEKYDFDILPWCNDDAVYY